MITELNIESVTLNNENYKDLISKIEKLESENEKFLEESNSNKQRVDLLRKALEKANVKLNSEFSLDTPYELHFFVNASLSGKPEVIIKGINV